MIPTIFKKSIKTFILLGVLFSTIPIHAATTLLETTGKNTPNFSRDNARLAEELQKQGVQVQATDKLKIILRVDALFKFPSSTQLLSLRDNTLGQVTRLVRNYGNRLVIVSGHTDNVGTDAAKFKRSGEQADTVAAYMWSQGVPLKNLVILGCGDTKPVASNLTPEGSAANRRIEIEIH